MNFLKPPSPIRAICTDIDGTLLNRDRQLSIATIETISRIGQRIPVILASSRMPSAMTHLQKELGILDHPMIAYNGGYVLRYSSNGLDRPEVFSSTEIPLAICKEILKTGSITSLHFSLYQDDEWYAPRDDEWSQREARITKVLPRIMDANEVFKLWEHGNRGAHKIMVMGNSSEISMLESELTRRFSTQIHVYHSRDTYLELAPKAISKASGLELIMRKIYNGTLEEVLAFGDNYNDIEMLQQVGWGIAVDNARHEVKEVSKDVTEASIHDGVALAIRKYCSDL